MGGTSDAFVSRFDGTGHLQWSTYLGGSKREQATAIAADPAGTLTVSGWTQSKDFPSLHPSDATLGGTQDAFLAQYSADGSAVFATYLGGSKAEQATGVAADPWGNVYVSGWTQSKDLPTVQPTDATLGGTQDAFVAQFNAGTSQFTSYLGGSKSDQALAVATDGWGRIALTGSTASVDFPLPATAATSPWDTKLGGTQDAFLVQYQIALQVPTPHLVGLTQTAATTHLAALRLTLGTITPAFSATVPADQVISQVPAAETLVALGTAVNLVVAGGRVRHRAAPGRTDPSGGANRH